MGNIFKGLMAWLVSKFYWNRQELLTYIQAWDWRMTTEEVDRYLRNHLKYGHDFEDPDEALDAVRNFLWGEMKERNLTLYD